MTTTALHMAACTRPPTGPAAAAAARYRGALPVLETERLTLRAPVGEDFALWARIFAGPGSEHIGGPAEPKDAWGWFAGYTAGWLLHGHGPFTVLRREDGTGLGFVLFGYEWDDEETELGWLFAEEARGQGYAIEAAVAVRDWGLGLLPTFVSCVDPENRPSTRLAERLGATLDVEASARLDTGLWRHGASA